VGVLQRFEDRLDRLVNGAFARAFRSEVQPVEVAAALQRELDDRSAVVSRDSTVAPNIFTVELGRSDYERLAPYEEPLNAELASMVTEHAENQGYTLIGPVEVGLTRVQDLGTGMFRITSDSRAGVVAQPRTQAAADAVATPAEQPQTHARLVVNDTAYPLVQPVTTLGRGTDVDIRVDDPGVSRKHAELRRSHDGRGFSVIDLASTNGTIVDGERIGERALADGDEIRLGSTVLVFRTG
jgi:hypothetical protein